MVPRRKSYGMVGVGRPNKENAPVLSVTFASSPDDKQGSSPSFVPTIPMLAREALIRRTSSGAHSVVSDTSTERGSQGTPTKKSGRE
jgi:hypothetical protein